MRTTLTAHIVGAALVLAALAGGAGFGSLTSPAAPAHAQEVAGTCTLVCADAPRTGTVGDVPQGGLASGQGGIGVGDR